MSKYSDGTNLVWKIAAIEAQNLNHQEIDPLDLMLGLLKIVDVDLEKIIQSPKPIELLEIKDEVTEIEQIFVNSGLVPAKIRRRLRRESFNQAHNVVYKNGIIHRSKLSKRIFSNAEGHLSSEETIIRPFHLLIALLEKHDADLDRALLMVSFPVYGLLSYGGSWLAYCLAIALIAIPGALIKSVTPGISVQLAPPEDRAVVMSFSYNMTYCFLGGTAPLLMSYLIGATHVLVWPAFYIMFFAVVSLFLSAEQQIK